MTADPALNPHRLAARQAVGRWLASPEAYARQVLGVEPSAGSLAIWQALAVPHSATCVYGAHGMAKSWSAAAFALAFASAGGTVVVAAGKRDQVLTGIWHEMRELLTGARIKAEGELLKTSVRIGSGEILAVGATTEGRARGMHRPLLAFVGDEAEAIEDGILRAWHGATAGGDVRRVLLGNPSSASGGFASAVKSGAWKNIQLDAFDSPNLVDVAFARGSVTGPGRVRELDAMTPEEIANPRVKYLAGPRFVLTTAAEYGVGTAAWEWMVRGRFPQQATDSLILAEWIEAARSRVIPPAADDETVAGIDVAAGGDDEHVMARRRGLTLIEPLATRRGLDPDALAGWTVETLRQWQPGLVRVDAIGVGAYLVPILRSAGFKVEAVKVSEKPDSERDQREYAIKRDHYWWDLRERFRAGTIAGVTDERLRVQLAEPRWREKGGQRHVESKDEMHARGIPWSPDRAEAVMLAYAPTRKRGPILAFSG